MAAIITSPVVGHPADIHTSQLNPLRTEADGYDVNGLRARYIYLQGCASLAAGMWVAYDEDGLTTILDSDTAASLVSQVAVACAVVDATTKYGWFQIVGNALASVGSVTADNGKLYASADAGYAEDAAVTGNQIHGAFARAATTTAKVALSEVQIDRPYIGVADAII